MMSAANKQTLPLNPQRSDSSYFPLLSATSNPLLSGIHVVLKFGIIAAYLIVPLFTKSLAVLQFLIIAAAMDFWIVKNVCGRLLVGLRWWVDFNQAGDEQWKFECKVNEKDVNAANEKVFWWTMVVVTLVWVLLVVINILRIDITQTTICLFCGAMVAFNLFSYYKCSKVQSENVKKLAAQYGMGVATQFMGGSIIANYF